MGITFRFYTHGRKFCGWNNYEGYSPRVGDELLLPKKYFPKLYEDTDFDNETWEVLYVRHRFDSEYYYGVDLYVRNNDDLRTLK